LLPDRIAGSHACFTKGDASIKIEDDYTIYLSLMYLQAHRISPVVHANVDMSLTLRARWKNAPKLSIRACSGSLARVTNPAEATALILHNSNSWANQTEEHVPL
jgi:hypothetical protein